MSSSTSRHTDGVQRLQEPKREAQLHYEEGKSPAAWVGSLTALLGFLVLTWGAMGVNPLTSDGPSYALLGLGAALLVIASLATLVLKSMGYGTPARDL